MHKTFSFAFLAGAMLISATAVHAQGLHGFDPLPPILPDTLARLDTNGDKALSLTEFLAPLEKRFKRADTNGDGVLSGTELKLRHRNWIARIDTNKDGAISHDEFLAQAQATFKKADTNGDGSITLDEIKGLISPHAPAVPQIPIGSSSGAGFAPGGVSPTNTGMVASPPIPASPAIPGVVPSNGATTVSGKVTPVVPPVNPGMIPTRSPSASVMPVNPRIAPVAPSVTGVTPTAPSHTGG